MVSLQHVHEVRPDEFDDLIQVWEASVRATHDFVEEVDIQFFKPIVRNQALPSVTLRCVRGSDNHAVGFIGVSNGKIEMLFIRPEYRGQGLGKTLIRYALQHLDASELDVNEQNEQAIGFYQRMGFVVVGRSEADGMDKPYPLLHMRFSVNKASKQENGTK